MNCDRFAFTRDFKLILLVIGLLFFFIISVRLDLEETPLRVKTNKKKRGWHITRKSTISQI